MELIILRHPETIANKEKLYIGQTESDYTEKGIKQFNEILEDFKYDIDHIYTSPLNRCKILAKELGKKLDVDFELIESLNEMNFGIFDSKNYKEVQKLYQKAWNKWIVDYINYTIPEGESLRDLYERVEEFLNELKKKEDGTFLLITHGGVIQTLITLLLDLDIDDRWHFKISEGALIEISYVDDYGIINNLINY
ncbi:MAG: alpha-ribazole phosphatase [Senegalia sp. (in: firmicutes)]|uniref:alpha-ribazole phosphatase n=1 Tax=Senegalia sp. (in: firmicutes) TaxID=1924098 RepID=UPI003F9A0158